MTEEQEQLITLLFIKYGGWKAVTDAWLYSYNSLSEEEDEAIDAWMKSDRSKPHNLPVVKDSDSRAFTCEIELEIPKRD